MFNLAKQAAPAHVAPPALHTAPPPGIVPGAGVSPIAAMLHGLAAHMRGARPGMAGGPPGVALKSNVQQPAAAPPPMQGKPPGM